MNEKGAGTGMVVVEGWNLMVGSWVNTFSTKLYSIQATLSSLILLRLKFSSNVCSCQTVDSWVYCWSDLSIGFLLLDTEEDILVELPEVPLLSSLWSLSAFEILTS